MAEATILRNNVLPSPIYGLPYSVVIPIFDADGDLVTGATALDSEISKNGDTFSDTGTEATEIATNSGMYYIPLTGTEMTANIVAGITKTSTSGAKTTPWVLYPRILPVERSNTAQDGGASTITLDASANANDDYFNGCIIHTTGGTGPNQVRMIVDYVGLTKVATVSPAWATQPDVTTTFDIYVPETANAQVKGLASLTDIEDQVWDAAVADHPDASSVGERIGRVPNAVAGGNGGLPTVDAANRLAGIQGTKNVLDDLDDPSVSDILTTQMTEAYAADGVAPTLAQALSLIMQSIGDFSISGTTLTVKKLDGSTPAATYNLDDASDPTSRTRAT